MYISLVSDYYLHIVFEPLNGRFGCAEHFHPELHLLVLQGYGIVQHEDEVGRYLYPRDVYDDGVAGVPRVAGPRVVESDDPEAVHDAVQDVG